MNFMLAKGGWSISFLEHDCRTSLPLKLTFGHPDKIRERGKRYGSQVSADISSMEYGIKIGRGGIWLMVDQVGYKVLKRVKTPSPTIRQRT